MKIVVLVRQTPDTEAQITANSSGNGIDESSIKWILNPFDEFAVEEAVQIKENTGAEVIILGVGPDRALETIRTALAMGGDSAIHIKDDNFGATDSYATAKLIAAKIKAIGEVDLILAGKKWIDEATKTAKVQSEIEGGQRIIELSFPALVTTERGINEPRYASLPGIMKAKKKPLEEVTLDTINLEELGLTAESLGVAGSRYKVDNIDIPVINRSLNVLKGGNSDMVEAGEVQAAAENLTKLLREEAKII